MSSAFPFIMTLIYGVGIALAFPLMNIVQRSLLTILMTLLTMILYLLIRGKRND
jgi:hypothetical protein